MKRVLFLVLAAVLVTSVTACQDGDDHNDSTGHGEKQDRIDATRGTRPN